MKREHQTMSQLAQIALLNKLVSLKITDFPTRHGFLISFQEVINRYDQIADKHLDDSLKKTLLHVLVMQDTALLNSWNTFTEVKRAQYLGGITTVLTYTEYLESLMRQSKLRDLIATSFKRPTTNFDSFYESNDDFVGDEDASVLDEFIPQPLYGELSRELRMAWSREPNDIKERILNIKQQAPKQGAKKKVDLGVYMIESEGYESDASAYSEHTYDYDVDG